MLFTRVLVCARIRSCVTKRYEFLGLDFHFRISWIVKFPPFKIAACAASKLKSFLALIFLFFFNPLFHRKFFSLEYQPICADMHSVASIRKSFKMCLLHSLFYLPLCITLWRMRLSRSTAAHLIHHIIHHFRILCFFGGRGFYLCVIVRRLLSEILTCSFQCIEE